MFYYYGRKKRMAKWYPEPVCDTVIEPFAGSAAYSLHGDNWKKNVILVEKDPKVAAIWKWFIHEATQGDIDSLPPLSVGDKSSNFLEIVHCVSKGAFGYKEMTVTGIMAQNWNNSRKAMSESLHKVKHWQIVEGDYTNAPDIEATWFIDPPYKGDPGLGYRFSSKMLNYEELASWIQSRQGQVIACEGIGGDYLPFTTLRENTSVGGKRNVEMVWLTTPL